MVFQSQSALMNGYNTMLVSVGDFQYSYRLWFEDETNLPIILDKPLNRGLTSNVFVEAVRKGKPVTGSFYRDLTRRLFPNQRRIKCYELYTLYLGGVNAKTVNSHNNSLIERLRSR